MSFKIGGIWFFAIMLFLFNGPVAGDDSQGQTYSSNGVTVNVIRHTDSIKGFKSFKVTAVNKAGAKRTLNSKIHLNNSCRKELKGASGSCTVYMELNPGEEKSQIKQCKETAESNTWSFEIVKVYNF